MPLHAAGTVFGTNHGMPELCSDYVVSSYTTTIATLLRAQENFTSMTLPSTQILFIGEPAAPGMTPLPGVQTELEAIKKALDDHVFSLISTSKGEITTVSEVTAGLANASIAHFACHGIQNSTSPLKSGFCLHDGLLTLAQLMRLKHKRASLAFLSACETAQGDLNQPDQSLHLCSAMLFCGFESVIGTMW
jgi:CHAT domain-containing protein